MLTKTYDFTTEYEKALFSVTKTCTWCCGFSNINMTYKQHERYVQRETYVQDIFPHISKELCEVLITGTHPECWIEMFEETNEEAVFNNIVKENVK
jgi:hypothetical protein